jgi:hypothetical protein
VNARKVAVTALALTLREGRRLLRVRHATLQDLIRRRELEVVPWGRAKRIPLESLQALARRGFTVDGKPSRAVSRPRRASPVQGRIRDLEVE